MAGKKKTGQNNKTVLFPETSEKVLMEQWSNPQPAMVSPGVKDTAFSGNTTLFPETGLTQEASSYIDRINSVEAAGEKSKSIAEANRQKIENERQKAIKESNEASIEESRLKNERIAWNAEQKIKAQKAANNYYTVKSQGITYGAIGETGNLSTVPLITDSSTLPAPRVQKGAVTAAREINEKTIVTDGYEPKKITAEDLGNTTIEQEAVSNQGKTRARGRKLQKLAEGSEGHLSGKAAPSMKELGFTEKLSNGFTSYSGLKSNNPFSLGKLGKMALGGAVLGGVLMTMMSNGGHQTNEQLYGQQPVNR